MWIAANSPGSTEIAVLHNSRLLGKISGDQGDPAKLGYGPVSLRVVGVAGNEPKTYAWARPVELIVQKK